VRSFLLHEKLTLCAAWIILICVEMGRERRRLQGPHAGNRKRYAPSLGSPASILPPSTRLAPSLNVELYVHHRFRALGLDQNREIQAYVVEVKSVWFDLGCVS
jgi:hypothetical protein